MVTTGCTYLESELPVHDAFQRNVAAHDRLLVHVLQHLRRPVRGSEAGET